MEKKRVKASRSRTGCFTCRKRKKKCDELSYPSCQNCLHKNLQCEWPALKHEIHRKLQQVKYIAEPKKNNTQEIRHRQRTETPWEAPKISKKTYFLERIAMQQDCVDEDEIESQLETGLGSSNEQFNDRGHPKVHQNKVLFNGGLVGSTAEPVESTTPYNFKDTSFDIPEMSQLVNVTGNADNSTFLFDQLLESTSATPEPASPIVSHYSKN